MYTGHSINKLTSLFITTLGSVLVLVNTDTTEPALCITEYWSWQSELNNHDHKLPYIMASPNINPTFYIHVHMYLLFIFLLLRWTPFIR